LTIDYEKKGLGPAWLAKEEIIFLYMAGHRFLRLALSSLNCVQAGKKI
jgi:hypothetical protein